MKRTEEDAKRLWCPLLRLESECIASRCMSWRWLPPARDEMRIYHASETYRKGYGSVDVGSAFRLVNGMPWFYEHTSVDELGVFDLLTREKHGAEPLGYCGLAGKPD